MEGRGLICSPLNSEEVRVTYERLKNTALDHDSERLIDREKLIRWRDMKRNIVFILLQIYDLLWFLFVTESAPDQWCGSYSSAVIHHKEWLCTSYLPAVTQHHVRFIVTLLRGWLGHISSPVTWVKKIQIRKFVTSEYFFVKFVRIGFSHKNE